MSHDENDRRSPNVPWHLRESPQLRQKKLDHAHQWLTDAADYDGDAEAAELLFEHLADTPTELRGADPDNQFSERGADIPAGRCLSVLGDPCPETVARALYGARWEHLPPFAQRASALFVPRLLGLGVADILNCGFKETSIDLIAELVPTFPELLSMMANPITAADLLDAADQYGWDIDEDEGADACFREIVVSGFWGLTIAAHQTMVDNLWTTPGLAAFGLDAESAAAAAVRAPEWCGTLSELIDAAPGLVSG